MCKEGLEPEGGVEVLWPRSLHSPSWASISPADAPQSETQASGPPLGMAAPPTHPQSVVLVETAHHSPIQPLAQVFPSRTLTLCSRVICWG